MTSGTTSIIEQASAAGKQQNISRQDIMAELEKIGVTPSYFEALTVDQLSDLLFGFNRAMNANAGSNATKRIAKRFALDLSSIDKKILRALVESKGNPSSLQLSRALDVPLSTIQRRRKRLEEEFVTESYSLKYEKFGKRQVTFIISVGARDRTAVAKEILELDKVISVSCTFGDGADLKVEVILETNPEFIDISEKIRAVESVQKISWFESMEVLGKNKEIDLSIIGME